MSVCSQLCCSCVMWIMPCDAGGGGLSPAVGNVASDGWLVSARSTRVRHAMNVNLKTGSRKPLKSCKMFRKHALISDTPAVCPDSSLHFLLMVMEHLHVSCQNIFCFSWHLVKRWKSAPPHVLTSLLALWHSQHVRLFCGTTVASAPPVCARVDFTNLALPPVELLCC